MPPNEPPTEQEIRAQLKEQGIDNFGQLVSQAAKLMRERGDIDAARWYVLFGDAFVFIVDMEPWA